MWSDLEPVLREFFRPFRGLKTLSAMSSNWSDVFYGRYAIYNHHLRVGIPQVLSSLGMNVRYVWIGQANRRIEGSFPPVMPGQMNPRAHWDNDPEEVYGPEAV
jgi:hypothetical protein